uniref:hypothetical protein n=1 Tax=Thaumasiovibrio occultus TaxID=1891184 RepID=UPI000B3507EF|nr:hypothetical protein [Thaumasiovibrio occultus]
MMKWTLSALALLVSVYGIAQDELSSPESVTSDYAQLVTQFSSQMAAQDYSAALVSAIELNQRDPSDSNALLYLVMAYQQAGKPLPEWVLAEPWPNGSAEDVINRQLAQMLVE